MSRSDRDELAAEFGPILAVLIDGLPESPGERPSEATWSAIAADLGLDPTPSAPDRDAETGGDGDGEGGGEGQVDVADRGDDTGVPAGPADPEGVGPPESVASDRANGWSRPLVILTTVVAALLVLVPLVLALS